MAEALEITIADLPKETTAAIISAAQAWACTPGEAVRRILNTYLGQFAEQPAAQPQPA